MTTTEREMTMARLARIAEVMAELLASFPTARECELRDRYPRMSRERIVRIVASEMVPE